MSFKAEEGVATIGGGLVVGVHPKGEEVNAPSGPLPWEFERGTTMMEEVVR